MWLNTILKLWKVQSTNCQNLLEKKFGRVRDRKFSCLFIAQETQFQRIVLTIIVMHKLMHKDDESGSFQNNQTWETFPGHIKKWTFTYKMMHLYKKLLWASKNILRITNNHANFCNMVLNWKIRIWNYMHCVNLILEECQSIGAHVFVCTAVRNC